MTAWIPAALDSALVVALLLGIVCGLLGTFVVVRRMALTGDMLSHAVLPGVVAGLAWSSSRDPLVVLGCALVAGVAGSWVMGWILRNTRLKADAALALVLSVFFAVGIAMISRLQPAGVQAFLFGQVAAIDLRDLKLLATVAAVCLLLVPIAFRVLCLVSFDLAFARLIGIRVKWIEAVFFLLLAAVIVIAMQAVGVVLVTAMLVTPAAAARFCTASLVKTAILACVLGAVGGMLGVSYSASGEGLPTGPLMALAVTGLFGLAAIFGPRGGWLPEWLRRRRERLRILSEDLLKRLWRDEEARERESTLEVSALQEHEEQNIARALRKMAAEGLILRTESRVGLSAAGRGKATELVRAHRLWERYLTERAAYKSDHVHDDAEKAEHWIDAEARRRLEERLGSPAIDPHGRPIPPSGEKGVGS